MKNLTVKQLAAISGVTVRALHHYDEIGLLAPASIGTNGYRYYGRQELLRLQRILFHRELGVSLHEISELLKLEGDDEIGVLLRHREKLCTERDRYSTLINTIDNTIAALKHDSTLPNADLYHGFSHEKQAGYEAWLIDQYGEPMRSSIERSRKAYVDSSDIARKAVAKELQEVEASLAQGLREGIEPTSTALDHLVARHRNWVAMMWSRPCSPEAYAGLADLYLSHPDFVARYERLEKGFAEYLASAMKAHASRLHS